MPSREHTTASGARLLHDCPSCARRWLGMSLEDAPELLAAIAGAEVSRVAVVEILEVCAGWTRAVEGVTDECGEPIRWADLDAGERVELLGVLLSPAGALEYLGAIRDVYALDVGLLDAMRDYLLRAYTGGCECAVCEGRRPVAERERSGCHYAGLDPRVWALYHRAAPLLERVDVDAPIWLYQIAQVAAEARGAAWVERERQRRRSDLTQGLLGGVL